MALRFPVPPNRKGIPMAFVQMTGHLRRFFPGLETGEIEIEAASVAALIGALDGRFPGLRDYLCDERGALRRHVLIFLDDAQIADRTHLSDPLTPHAQVFIVQALSGG